MEPQVGYIVQYHVRPDEAHKNGNSLLAAAVITRVHSHDTGLVNLRVLWDSSETGTGHATSVLRGKESGQWSPIEMRLQIESEATPAESAPDAPSATDAPNATDATAATAEQA